MAGRGSHCGKEGTIFLHLVSLDLVQDYSSSETRFLGKRPITTELQGLIRGLPSVSPARFVPFCTKGLKVCGSPKGEKMMQ